MATTVLVNQLTIVNQDSGGVAAVFPDVCKTPSPGGPVPIPYPNVARSADTSQGSQTVKANGKPFMLRSSCFAQSTGDEPGTAGGGVVSGKTKGKAYPKSYSFDVKVEGENVFRMSDVMLQNGGSPTNTGPGPLMQPNQPGAAKRKADDDFPELTSLTLSASEAWCGDQVFVEAQGAKDAPDDPIAVGLWRADEKAVHNVVFGNLSGKKMKEPWVVRRGKYAKDVKLRARYRNPGKELASGDLVVKAPEPVAKELKGPRTRRTPQYVKNAKTGVMGPNGAFYEWQYGFEIELKPGELVITRHVEFDVQPGANPPSEAQKKLWKQEIEGVWDARFRLHRASCKRGQSCQCPPKDGCCALTVRVQVEFGPAPFAVPKVKLHAGACDPDGWGKARWWYSNDWWERADHVPATVRPHEFGHLIGMYDEYPEGACDPARKYTNDAHSVMGGGSKVFDRHLDDFLAWLEGKLPKGFGYVEAHHL